MDASFEHAVQALKAGRAVIFPTDTVYGLGVAPRYAESPQEIFDLKQRPADKPVAWLVGGIEDLGRYGVDVSARARKLAEEGWPGGLTIIVKASSEVPPPFQSAEGTIGLRMPDSSVARALISEVGPIAASSANRSGGRAPRSFDEIELGLLEEVAVFVCDGDKASGTPSTVLDATGEDPVVLRP